MACLVRMITIGTPEAAWGLYWCVERDTLSFPTTNVCTYPCFTNPYGLPEAFCVRTQATILVKYRHKTEAICIHVLLRSVKDWLGIYGMNYWSPGCLSPVVGCCWCLRGSEDPELLLILTGHSWLLQSMGLSLGQLLLGFLMGWKCGTHPRDPEVYGNTNKWAAHIPSISLFCCIVWCQHRLLIVYYTPNGHLLIGSYLYLDAECVAEC